MVTSCGKEVCITLTPSPDADLNLWVPVTDQRGISYINAKCALCNNITEVVPWEVYLQWRQESNANISANDITNTAVSSSDVLDQVYDRFVDVSIGLFSPNMNRSVI